MSGSIESDNYPRKVLYSHNDPSEDTVTVDVVTEWAVTPRAVTLLFLEATTQTTRAVTVTAEGDTEL